MVTACQGTIGALQYLIGRPETTYSVYDGGGTDIPIPIYDDGYTVALANEFTPQPFKVGRRGDRYRSLSRRNVAGALHTGFFTTKLAYQLLNYAVTVDASGCLTPWSFTSVTPSVETKRHLGCFVNQLTMAASDGTPTLMFQADIMGRSEQSIAEPGLPSFPSAVAYEFQYGHFLASADDGATFALLATVESFQLQLDNNLQPGPHMFDPVVYNNLTRSFINTGIQKITGNIAMQYASIAYSDQLRAATRGELRLMFVHPTSVRTQVNNVAGYAAGNNVAIIVDSSVGIVVGDIVLFRTADTTKISVAKVTVVADVTHIEVDTLDFAVADNDYVYSKGLELKIAAYDLLNAAVAGGFAADLKQTLNFEAADEGTGLPFTFKAKAN
jgi:hypothetical protein